MVIEKLKTRLSALKQRPEIAELSELLNRYLMLPMMLVLISAAIPPYTTLFDEDSMHGITNLMLTKLVYAILLIPVGIALTKLIKHIAPSYRHRVFYLALLWISSKIMLEYLEPSLLLTAAMSLLVIALTLLRLKQKLLWVPVCIFSAELAEPSLFFFLMPFLLLLPRYLPHLNEEEREKQKKLNLLCIAALLVAAAERLVLDIIVDPGVFALHVSEAGDLFYELGKGTIVFLVVPFFIFAYSKGPKLLPMLLLSGIPSMLIYFFSAGNNPSIAFVILQCGFMIGACRESLLSYWKALPQKYVAPLASVTVVIVLQQIVETYYKYVDNFVTMPFYISYQDFGLIQRGVWGTVFRILFGEYIPQQQFEAAYFSIYAIFRLLLAVGILLLLRQCKNSREKAVFGFFAVLFLISPAFDMFFIETFNCFMALLCIYLAFKNKQGIWLVPVLCLIGMLTHQIFASIIFPIVFIALVYRALIDNQGHPVRNTVILGVTLCVVGASFYYLTFENAKRISYTAEQMFALVEENSGGFVEPHEDLVRYVWLDTEHVHAGFFQDLIHHHQIENAIEVFCLNIPFLVVYGYAFLRSAVLTPSKRKKAAYVISMISILAIMPAFVTETDYGRWCTQYLVTLIIGPAILALYQKEDEKWYRTVPTPILHIFGLLLVFMALIQPDYGQMLYNYTTELI